MHRGPLLQLWLLRRSLSSLRPLRILTPLQHGGFGVALQRCFPYSVAGHKDTPGNDGSRVRKAPVGQGGPRGSVVSDIQPSTMPQSNIMFTLDGCVWWCRADVRVLREVLLNTE